MEAKTDNDFWQIFGILYSDWWDFVEFGPGRRLRTVFGISNAYKRLPVD